jgi:protein SCO1/2
MSVSPLQLVNHFFGSWRFPIFAMAVVVGYELLMLGLLLWPAGEGQLASFANEFRIWCFGYDPATGNMQWASLLTTFTSPLIMVGVMLVVWGEPLRRVLRQQPWAIVPYIGAAALLVAASGLYLTAQDPKSNQGELPFPARALRLELQPPEIRLTNQDGDDVDLAALRGRVVLLTAVYARCGNTCPMILGQARRVIAGLSAAERREVTVIGITLDPQNDDQTTLAGMAVGQGVSAPTFNFCTGDPATVETILDRLDVSRSRDPETGVIDHANLFLLVDRQGRIAYRLSLGDRQERWLQTALRTLLSEDRT